MISASENKQNISTLGKSIIRTLAYYDIFNYPLTADEIYFNLGTNHVSTNDISLELENLCSTGIVFSKDNYFLLKDNEEFIHRRLAGNKLAEKKLISAYKMSRFISYFPYVRAIMLSGSISKGYMEKDSDVDYFIITHPNRLWITRLLLMIFKKVFLLNSRKIFCINYFVDSETLEIEEQNIFTATELVTLIPTYNADLYNTMFDRNMWVNNYYPNFVKRATEKIYKNKRSLVKSVFEMTLNNILGDKLDDFAMKLFDKSNRVKYRNYDTADFKIAFKTSKRESKHHPKFFQKRVLEAFNQKLKNVEETFNISLS
jgi:predicted nucleotidyltransferase